MTKHKKERRKIDSNKKMELLKLHFVNKKPISEIREQHGISPAMFYKWQATIFENGDLIFNTTKGNKPTSIESDLSLENKELRQKLSAQNSVMLELMEEHVKLKKKIGSV